MSITIKDVRQVARLAQIELDSSEEEQTLTHLNGLFNLIDQMSNIDTTNVEPLTHPISMIQEINQRLRTDEVSEANQREANMANAPQAESGLFLVPKVID